PPGAGRRIRRNGCRAQEDAAGGAAQAQDLDALMSRLVVPISSKILWSTGDILLWTDLELLLRDRAGAWKPESFRIDTATEMTAFSAHRASQLGLPMPQNTAPGAIH